MQNNQIAGNPETRVTERMKEDGNAPGLNGQVPPRLQEQRVTDRLESPTADAPPPQTQTDMIGTLIDHRYRVEEVLTTKSSGEADIYKCFDQSSDSVMALKMYRFHVEPKKDVLERLVGINHPDIVNVRGYGSWGGRFFEAMEFCAGGGMDRFMPYTENELTLYLQEMINGLNYCHNQGIIHRDIKPSNLFFRQPGKVDLVIGDFGISSALDMDQKVRKTQSFANLTVDYTAPELFSREKTVSSRTDYYALGITLIHLFTGRSPFQDMDVNSIISAHLTEAAPLPDSLSDRFKTLLRGLTEKNIANRWAYPQVQQWLNGETILNDDGAVWSPETFSGKLIPYPGCPAARTPKELVEHFAAFNVEKDLFRGRISQWAYQFDPILSDRIIDIEENFTQDKPLGVFKLKYLLNPGAPFYIAGIPVQKGTELLPLLANPDPEIQADLRNALDSRHLEYWLSASPDISDKKGFETTMQNLRERLKAKKKEALAPFSLLYILAPEQPLALPENHMIARPEELSGLLETHPRLMPGAVELLTSGKLEEWLTCAFPDRVHDIEFVRNCLSLPSMEVAVFSICCHFDPKTPFPFGTLRIQSPAELAEHIEKDGSNRDMGVAMLKNGMIRAWLVTTGRLRDEAAFSLIVDNPDLSWEAKLEEILHLLAPSLPRPLLKVSKKAIRLGNISPNARELILISVENAGRGHLYGTVKLQGPKTIFILNSLSVEGGDNSISLEINPRGLTAGTYKSANLCIASNGGDLEIPISFSVGLSVPSILGRSLKTGLVFAFLLGLLRLVISNMHPDIPVFYFNRVNSADPETGAGLAVSTLALLAFIFVVYLWFRPAKEEYHSGEFTPESNSDMIIDGLGLSTNKDVILNPDGTPRSRDFHSTPQENKQ